MGVFEHFPYVNYHDLNLSWILRKLKELEDVIGSQIVDIVARAGVAENAQAIADLTDTVEENATTAHNEASAASQAAAAAQSTADGAASAASAAQTSANTANTALARRGINISQYFQRNAAIASSAAGVDAFYDPYSHIVHGNFYVLATTDFGTSTPIFTITNASYRPTQRQTINGIIKTSGDVVFPSSGTIAQNGEITQGATGICRMVYFTFFYSVA